jgi:hypothetical protein
MAQLHLVTPVAQALPREPVFAPLSLKLWDLDWRRILPWTFEEVTVESGTFEDALPFITENYARIFGTDDGQSRFLVEPMTPAKRRFGAEMDVFLFRAEGKVIGVVMGHASDWSTYYLRTAAYLPEYRSRHLVQGFFEAMCAPLRDAGVVRVESDVTPTNVPMMRAHLGQGFIVSSTTTSERWGLVARMTKFLQDDAEAIFVRQFCGIAVKNQKSTKPEINRRMP